MLEVSCGYGGFSPERSLHFSAFDRDHFAIAHFLTLANYGTLIGNFELDFSDGEIRYKTSIDVQGDRLTPALIKRLVYTNVTMMDDYLPGIQAVVAGQDPAEAIRAIEQPSQPPQAEDIDVA